MADGKHGLTRYKHGPDEHGTRGRGCRCATCRDANTAWQRNRGRMIAYGRWDGLLDATGVQRRLQALMFNGWSLGLLSARLGCTRQVTRVKLTRDQTTAATVAAVRALYDELWDQQPPETNRFERRNATMARRYARDHGWVPPAAWDDDEIDDPEAVPADGWERGAAPRRYGVLAEDAGHLLRAGESAAHVAGRLGISEGTLATVLERAARKQRRREAARAA